MIFKKSYMIFDIGGGPLVELSINQPENMHKIAVLNFSRLQKQYLQFFGRADGNMVIRNTQSQNGYHEDFPVTTNIMNWDENPEYRAIVWYQDGLLDLTRCTTQQLHTKTTLNLMNGKNDLADCVKLVEIAELDLVLV